jgi:hypothetical protein
MLDKSALNDSLRRLLDELNVFVNDDGTLDDFTHDVAELIGKLPGLRPVYIVTFEPRPGSGRSIGGFEYRDDMEDAVAIYERFAEDDGIYAWLFEWEVDSRLREDEVSDLIDSEFVQEFPPIEPNNSTAPFTYYRMLNGQLTVPGEVSIGWTTTVEQPYNVNIKVHDLPPSVAAVIRKGTRLEDVLDPDNHDNEDTAARTDLWKFLADYEPWKPRPAERVIGREVCWPLTQLIP